MTTDADLFRSFVKQHSYSEIISLPSDLGEEPIKVECKNLSENKLTEAIIAAKRTVANMLGIKPFEVSETDQIYLSEMQKEAIVRCMFIPGRDMKFFTSSADLGEVPSDIIYMLFCRFSEVQAKASAVLSVTSTDMSEGSGNKELFEKLKSQALSPEFFFQQSSPESQILFMTILVDQLLILQKENTSLTLQLSKPQTKLESPNLDS